MDSQQILAALTAERDRLNRAIEALREPTNRRGRPPKNALTLNGAAGPAPALAHKKRTFTAAQRKEQAKRMKAYWAAKRKQAKKG